MHSVIVACSLFLIGGTTVVSLWLLSRLAQSTLSTRLGADRSLRRTRQAGKAVNSLHRGVHLRKIYPVEDETDTDIDLIAIHGLDAKSPGTWTWEDPRNPEKRANWLQDAHMLPSKVGRARIFTCDWPSELLQPSDSVQKTVEEFALLLLDGIQRRLPRTSGDRPILFVASCLGGIILIKALVEARENHPVKTATRGIIFLGTPFRGTSFQEVASWAEPGLKALAKVQGQEVSSLLDSVKGPTVDLDALRRRFTDLFRDRDPPCYVFNFYELGKTSLTRKLFPWLPRWLCRQKVVRNVQNSPLTRSTVMITPYLQVTNTCSIHSWSGVRQRP